MKVGVPSTTSDVSENPPVSYAGMVFAVGDFSVVLIPFIIVAFIVFLIVKITEKWKIE